MNVNTTTGLIPAYLTGALALDTSNLTPEQHVLLQQVRDQLTLQRNLHPVGFEATHFWYQQDQWLYIPRGFPLTDGGWLIPHLNMKDGRSTGRSLPVWSRLEGVELGIPPYPKGQPRFVWELVQGSRASGIGGHGLAPTRSGKTLCAIAAALELGYYTLILVDSVELMRQWQSTIENHVIHGGAESMPVGHIRGTEFNIAPFTIATVQTLARRRLDDDARRAFGTIILDECQSAPCDQIWGALARFHSSAVLGMTATPRRADGLGSAIPWLCGPHIATLERKIEADVRFLHFIYRPEQCKIPKVNKQTGQPYMAAPRLTQWGKTNTNEAAKAMYANPDFCPWLAMHIAAMIRDGRRVLVMVHLKSNATDLAAACRALGMNPGLFMGTMDASAARAAMQKNPCIATLKKAGRGIDFKPAPTALVIAAPLSDPEQPMGRGLQPQAEHKPLLVDVVVGAKPLVKQAYSRLKHYRRRGFDVLNEPWVGETA